MKPITVIFFGRSGSGKGTQADLLIKYLAKKDPGINTLYVETGGRFRKFLNESSTYTAEKTRGVLGRGGLMPVFMPIWTWTGLLVDEFTGKEHLVFDGVARRIDESPVLDGALEFYGRTDTKAILLDVPEDEVTGRLIRRGRNDDHHEKIQERLKWFRSDVMPSVDYFRKSKNCTFVEINGHQTIEKVHADILKELGI